FGKNHSMTANATAPSGRLTRNTQRQPGPSVRKPPTIGPTMLATPNTEPNRPPTRPRCAGGNMSAIVVKPIAVVQPAPTPWKPRDTTNWVIDCAVPHSALPATKTATPPSRNSLRPYRSLSLPKMGTPAVLVNMYAVVTHA